MLQHLRHLLADRNLIANYLGQVWTALMGFAFVPVYIRYMGLEAYGLIGLFAVLQAWLGLLDIGLTPALSREMARFSAGVQTPQSIRDLLRSAEVTVASIAAAVATLVVMTSNWIATSWLRTETLSVAEVAGAVSVMGLVSALRFVEGVYRSSVYGLQRHVRLNLVTGVMATVRGLGAVAILRWVSPSIVAFFAWQAVVSVLSVYALSILTYALIPRGERPGRFSSHTLRSVTQFAGGMFVIALTGAVLMQVDKVLLSRLLSLGEYGVFTLASVAAGALLMLVAPITQSYYPRLCASHAANDGQEIGRVFHDGARLVSLVAGSAAVMMLVHAETLLALWTKDPDVAFRAAPLFRLLTLGNLLNGLNWMPHQAQLAHGWTSLSIRSNLIAIALLIPAVFWITPRYGASGAAGVWVLLNAGYLTIGAHVMFRSMLVGEQSRWYVRDIAMPLGSGLIVAVTLNRLWPQANEVAGTLIRLVVSAVAVVGSAAILTLTHRSATARLTPMA